MFAGEFAEFRWVLLWDVGVTLLLDEDGVGDGNGEAGLGWEGATVLDELADGIWTVVPPPWGLLTAPIWFSCLEFIEFWWRSPLMVTADVVDGDWALTELFALAMPLLTAASCAPAARAEPWSLWFKFWGRGCCCSGWCACCGKPGDADVLLGKLTRLSEQTNKRDLIVFNYIWNS